MLNIVKFSLPFSSVTKLLWKIEKYLISSLFSYLCNQKLLPFCSFSILFSCCWIRITNGYLFKLILGPFTGKSKSSRKAFKQTTMFSTNSYKWSHCFCRISDEIIWLNYKGILLIPFCLAPHFLQQLIITLQFSSISKQFPAEV